MSILPDFQPSERLRFLYVRSPAFSGSIETAKDSHQRPSVMGRFGTARPGVNRLRFRAFGLCSLPCRAGFARR